MGRTARLAKRTACLDQRWNPSPKSALCYYAGMPRNSAMTLSVANTPPQTTNEQRANGLSQSSVTRPLSPCPQLATPPPPLSQEPQASPNYRTLPEWWPPARPCLCLYATEVPPVGRFQGKGFTGMTSPSPHTLPGRPRNFPLQ